MNASARRSQAGAVHTMWLVTIMILWLATLALLYVTNADISASEAATVNAEIAKRAAVDKFEAEFDRFKALSDVVGYTDPADISSRSNIAAMQLDLEAAKTAVGNALGSADTPVTADQALKALMAARQSALTAKQAAETALDTELKARQQADAKVAALESQYKSQLAKLKQDLADEQQRSATQASNYDRQLADLRDQQQAADDTARATQRSLDQAQLEASKKLATKDGIIAKLAQKRAPVEPAAPDGEVLAVSADGSVAWIDIGARNGLRPGTRFEVLRQGKGGEFDPRGMLEVREVEDDMATAGLIGQADSFDPILPGDVVRNESFSRNRALHFFLLGDFPLSFSKELIADRLHSVGAEVDSTLGTDTDVLVLGHKNLNDEFAVDLDQTDEYHLADRLGMRIMQLTTLEKYLRF